MTDPRPLAERVRDIAKIYDSRANDAHEMGLKYYFEGCKERADTLREAADALEARKERP
jgi:hypothetical protein